MRKVVLMPGQLRVLETAVADVVDAKAVLQQKEAHRDLILTLVLSGKGIETPVRVTGLEDGVLTIEDIGEAPCQILSPST
jgi:hypothetical protein